MLSFDQLFSLVSKHCAHGQAVADETMTPRGIGIPVDDLTAVCSALHGDSSAFFDMLSCVSAVDNGPGIGTIDLIYNLYSIPFNHHLALKITVSRDQAEVDTVEQIWKTANWHEREAFDMFGIKFREHSDLRRILLPADWEGHPLRKDYKQQEYYRGVKLE